MVAQMKEAPQAVLGRQIRRNLSDRSYEKRKQAALEIEQIIKDFNPALPTTRERVRCVIAELTTDYAYSTQLNSRKGGLIGLSAVAVALLYDAAQYLELLLPPVLRCFNDPESRVRYYACEALYNISKVVRGYSLVFFNEIFDGLCKLCIDAEVDVKDGAQLLDRLVKDIVTETSNFDVSRFIPLLCERIRNRNPFIRQLVIGWISHLDSLKGIDMLEFLPEFLGGILDMLSDPNKDIRQQAYSTLVGLLKQITLTPSIDLSTMLGILVQQSNTSDPFTRIIVLSWIYEFLLLGKQSLLPYTADILTAIISCISDQEREIRQKAQQCNEILLRLVQETKIIYATDDIIQENIAQNTMLSYVQQIENYTITTANQVHGEDVGRTGKSNTNTKQGNLHHGKGSTTSQNKELEAYLFGKAGDIVGTLNLRILIERILQQLSKQFVPARLTALRWISMLLAKSNMSYGSGHASLSLHSINNLFPTLLSALLDPDEHVVRLDLQVIAHLCITIESKNENDQTNATSLTTATATAGSTAGSPSAPIDNISLSSTCINVKNFDIFIVNLIQLFSEDITFLEQRGALIIRHLCLLLNPEVVFKGIATLLIEIEEIEFTSLLVQTLNLILLTAPETASLRMKLRQSQETVSGRELFLCLYKPWCCAQIAVLSLCLLSNVYDAAAEISQSVLENEMTIGSLIQLDRVVQLIESPIFVQVRLHLLEPYKYPLLTKTLYNILMILPQGNVFNSLNTRLSAASRSIDILRIQNEKNMMNGTSDAMIPAVTIAPTTATGISAVSRTTVMTLNRPRSTNATISSTEDTKDTTSSTYSIGLLYDPLESYLTYFRKIQKQHANARETLAKSASLLAIQDEQE